MHTFLPNSAAIWAKLRDMYCMSTRGRRRVMLVAYVGLDGPSLLPDFQGVEVYCWPQVGATSPLALATLQAKAFGARVFLTDRLHAKLYWVDGIGYLVASANLSANALGEAGLHEVGVFVPATGDVDIDAIISKLSPRKATTAELRRLQRSHDVFWSKHAAKRASKARIPSYSEWFHGPRLASWKLGWWDTPGNEEESTAALAEAVFGVEAIEDFIDCSAGQMTRGDWILCFRLGRAGRALDLSWLFVQHVHRLTKAEARNTGYSHQAIQVRKISRVLVPPFAVSGVDFQRAFNVTLQAFGTARLKRLSDLKAPEAFLVSLASV